VKNHIILSANEIFITGTKKDHDDFRNTKCYLFYVTLDSNDKKVKMYNVALEGKNQNFAKTKNNIYLLNKIYDGKNSVTGPTKLYRFEIETENVVEIYQFNQFNVKSIFFEEDDLTGYALVGTSNYAKDVSFFYTHDGGYNWNELEIKGPVLKSDFKNNSIFFLTRKKNTIYNWIYRINTRTHKIDSLQFDLNIKDFHVESGVESGNEYWLLGERQDSVLLNRYMNGKIETVHVFETEKEYFPEMLYKYNDLIGIHIGKVDRSLLGGFGGTTHQVYLSYDNGKTWHGDIFSNPPYINPLEFFEDKYFAAYTGFRNLIVCKIGDQE